MLKKVHKIRNVDLTVCTAEQMLARNAADQISSVFGPRIAAADESTRPELIDQAINTVMGWFSPKAAERYNMETVKACLAAGLPGYLAPGCRFFSSYAEVGKAFPLPADANVKKHKVTAIYPDAGWVAVSTGFYSINGDDRMFFQGYTKEEVIYKLRHEYNMIVPNNVSSRKPSLADIFPFLGVKA